MMISFSNILIGVRDLQKAKPFYEELLGVEFAEFRPPFASFYLDGIEFNLEEDAPERDERWAEMYIGGRKPFALKVDGLREFLKQVEANGGRVVKEYEEKSWGWAEAVIADLDGNEFIVEEEILG